MQRVEQYQFQGIRTDLGDKLVDKKYFYDVINFNQDDIIGANKILAPRKVNNIEYSVGKAVDGIFGFQYLDTDNKLQREELVISGGTIFKNFVGAQILYSGMQEGICTFTIYQDKVFIANGKDYIKVYNGKAVYDEGAAFAEVLTTNGGQEGNYYYEVTFVTAGGEERRGSRSNVVLSSGKAIKLTLPIGYEGTTARKIYRTDGNLENPKLVTTINDNETLTYTDNLDDGSLTTNIIEINNEAPKPYFVETSASRLVACVADIYPTQSWISDTNVEVIDTANFLDISNNSRDNSSLVGMQRDYDKVILASKKQVYILDCNSEVPTVTETRANVGCINGYSMTRIPSEDDNFTGGVIFLASDKTIRVFNGNFAQPIATSLDNLNTDNYGQPIKRILEGAVNDFTYMHSEYFNFKYHLILNNIILAFDIRTQSWFKYYFGNDVLLNGFYDEQYYNPDYFVTGIETRALFSYFAVLDNKLYIGRKDSSLVECMYSDWKYRDTNVKSKLEFPYWGSDSELKYIREIIIFYQRTADTKFDVIINLDDDTTNQLASFEDKSGGFYNNKYYNGNFYLTGSVTEDYRVIYVNKYANWTKIIIESNEQPLIFRGMQIKYDTVTNKEVV